MKKIFIVLINLFALLFSTYSKGPVSRFGFSGNTPLMTEVEYSNTDNSIIIKNEMYSLSMEFTSNDCCKLNISNKKKNVQFSAHLKKEMIDSINSFYIDKKIPCILICYNIEGATGLSANITSGFLIKLKNKIEIIEISSFGDIRDHFIDLDNDGIFEFICIDLFYGELNRYFVPNVFSLTDKVKNITDRSKFFSICIDEPKETGLYPKDYIFIEEPMVLKNRVLYK